MHAAKAASAALYVASCAGLNLGTAAAVVAGTAAVVVVDTVASMLAVLLVEDFGDELPQAAIATHAMIANAQLTERLMFLDTEWFPRSRKPTGTKVARALRTVHAQ
jgi:hypothetical protein